MAIEKLILGVDAGGTKTRALLGEARSATAHVRLGEGEAGPGNPRAAGFEKALAAVGEAIEAAFAAAGIAVQPVAAACLAAAGADRMAEQTRYEQWAHARQLAAQLRVVNDALPVLAAGTRDDCGVGLIAGTGSLAFGRNSAGEIARAGGWGYLFGDEGSAYAVAVAGLRAAARAVDGRGPETALVAAFLKRLKLSDPSGLVPAIYHADMQRPQLAGMADVVLETALQGDREAALILQQACSELAHMVQAVVRRLRLAPGQYALALAGGWLVRHPLLQQEIYRQLDALALPPGFNALVDDPAEGALILARRMVGEP